MLNTFVGWGRAMKKRRNDRRAIKQRLASLWQSSDRNSFNNVSSDSSLAAASGAGVGVAGEILGAFQWDYLRGR